MNKTQPALLLPTMILVAIGLGFILMTQVQADTMVQPRTEPVPRSDYDDKYVIEESVDTKPYLFNANEWSLDAFAHYSFEASNGEYEDGFGPGLGLNYFVNRYVGFGLEGYTWEGDGYIGAASGNIMLRYPIEEWHLAPYLIGGVGGNFGADDGEDQVNGSGGIGVEYRIDEHWGIFTDGRYVATEKTNDYGIARAGVRFTF